MVRRPAGRLLVDDDQHARHRLPVEAYIGIVLSGRCVVGIADAAAPPEFRKRVRIADAHAVFTVDSYLRDGKVHDIYSKVIEADGPQAIVISRTGEKTRTARNDIAWTDFLSVRDHQRSEGDSVDADDANQERR